MDVPIRHGWTWLVLSIALVAGVASLVAVFLFGWTLYRSDADEKDWLIWAARLVPLVTMVVVGRKLAGRVR